MFPELFKATYVSMLPYLQKEDVILEIGCRSDRGVISSHTFDCKEFICLDARPERVEQARRDAKLGTLFVVSDALKDDLPPCDVIITTALIHHCSVDQLDDIFGHLAKFAKRGIIISGPNAEAQTELYGDHKYHIVLQDIESAANKCGFHVEGVTRFDDLAPPVTFFGEERAKVMAKNGQITIALRRGIESG